ncbi:RHS repeat-associated core domain-containing protein [Tumidithrix elongata RA019]|uniref:RHS repeat-associated core domain-containing protein n=1 Tax=Tumidithrix elongata BACA0141 TaxID=2716417 RepID=A0AAW9PZ20_9CYAN|nr:RHS repeat-associated core domain-containing protein [Tumidithrix elongata RA019]
MSVKGLYLPAQTIALFTAPESYSPDFTEAVSPAAVYTDGNGNIKTMRLNQRGDLVVGTDPVGNLTSNTYNNQHQLTQSSNARGQNTTYTYDSRGNVTRLVDSISGANGKQFTYDPTFNQITSVTDELGRVTTYQIDPANGNTLSATQTVGGNPQVTTYTYTPKGQVSTITDALGRITFNEYNAQGRLFRVTIAQGTADQAILNYEYNSAGYQTKFTDAKGNITLYSYDVMNRLTRVTSPDPDGAGTLTSPVNQYTYDLAGNRITAKDPRNNTTTYVYDALNRLIQITQPDPDGTGVLTSPITQYTYDPAGNRLTETDPLNRVTQYRYDGRNRLTQVINPLNQAITYGYDLDDNQTSVTDALNQTTTYIYDARNRLTRETNALNQANNYVYDRVDNLISITDALNQVTTFAYDSLDRRIIVTNPLNQTTTTTYDLVGNVLSVTNAANQTTRYVYDNRNRQIQIIDALNQITKLSYDLNGNLVQITDALNNVTSYQYDGLNRLTTETNPLNKTRTFSYGVTSNLVGIVDRNNRARKFSYDTLNRLLAEQWLDAAGVVTASFRFTFDAASQVLTASDPSSRYAFSYDAAGRQTIVDGTGTSGVPNVILTSTYDVAGNRISLTDNIAGVLKGTQGFGYDALQRLTRVTQSGSGVSNKRVDLIYDAVGRMSGISRFASTDQSVPVVNSSLTFDLASKLTALTHVRNATTINSNGLTYDAAARVTQLMTVDGSSGYGYDATSQLTAATHSYQTSEAFSYDALGNRTGYVTTANNRLQSDGTFTYLYDDEGNRTQRTNIATGEVTSYTWDYRNRLTGVDTKTSGGVLTRSVAFKYDIFDRRIAKTVDLDGAGAGAAVTERYVYDRDHIMLVFVGANLKERYLYGANLDQVLAVEASSQVNWTLSDYLGTVRDLVSSAGVVQKHIKYDSFGNVTAQSAPTVKSRFGFTGREFDSETGLYYYRSRYYDSAVGRFISEDRIGFAGGDANLYRYVGNSATNGTDPFGLQTYVLQLGTTLGKAAGTVATGAELSVLAPVLAFAGVLLGFPSAAGEGSDKVRPLPVSGFTNTAGAGFGGGLLTFPDPQESRPTIYISPNGRYSDPNVINRGRDFEDIGGICSVPQGFPIPQPLFPPFLEAKKEKNIDLGEGYKVPEDIYHPSGADGLKQEILQDVKNEEYKLGKVGKNPDIQVKDGKIVLQSQENKKISIKTDIPVSKYPEITKSK